MSRFGFSNEDYFNLLIIYGEYIKVNKWACVTFRPHYPDRPTTMYDALARLIHNCKTHGQFVKSKKSKPVVDIEVTVLA